MLLLNFSELMFVQKKGQICLILNTECKLNSAQQIRKRNLHKICIVRNECRFPTKLYKTKRKKIKSILLTVSRCSHELVEHGSHLIRRRHNCEFVNIDKNKNSLPLCRVDVSITLNDVLKWNSFLAEV